MKINIILVDNDVGGIKETINSAINTIDMNVKTFIATSKEEIVELVSKYEIDFIILNKELNIKFSTSKCKHIITIDRKVESKRLRTHLVKKLNKICETKKIDNINKRIAEELSKIGYNFKLSGTMYISEILSYIYLNDKSELLENLEANVYTVIAKKNNKTIDNIKTNIAKATKFVELYQDRDILYNYFLLDIKITPKLVLTTVMNKLLA